MASARRREQTDAPRAQSPEIAAVPRDQQTGITSALPGIYFLGSITRPPVSHRWTTVDSSRSAPVTSMRGQALPWVLLTYLIRWAWLVREAKNNDLRTDWDFWSVDNWPSSRKLDRKRARGTRA